VEFRRIEEDGAFGTPSYRREENTRIGTDLKETGTGFICHRTRSSIENSVVKLAVSQNTENVIGGSGKFLRMILLSGVA
jgi:hypothetical protein